MSLKESTDKYRLLNTHDLGHTCRLIIGRGFIELGLMIMKLGEPVNVFNKISHNVCEVLSAHSDETKSFFYGAYYISSKHPAYMD